MTRKGDRQLELVLENRQVLGIFFVIAILFGVFFSLGYVVGKNTASPAQMATVPNLEPLQADGKPSAMPAPEYLPRSGGGNFASASIPATPGETTDTDLEFYNSVEDSNPQASLERPSSVPDKSAGLTTVQTPPEGILVQVSALTRQEDAENLVALMKEKGLPVLLTSSASDRLFHVVVGPYESAEEAETVKRILEQDGFRPFLRK
jgi:DedD protein